MACWRATRDSQADGEVFARRAAASTKSQVRGSIEIVFFTVAIPTTIPLVRQIARRVASHGRKRSQRISRAHTVVRETSGIHLVVRLVV